MPVILAFDLTVNPSLKELGLSGREIKRLMKEVHQEIGEYWFDRMVKDHFREGAAQRYGYKPRTNKYLKRKARDVQKGKALTTADLIYSGLLRSRVTQRQWMDVHAYSTRVSVVMHGPKYVSMRPKKSNHPNLGEEITATTEDQRKELAWFAAVALANRVNKLNLPEKITIR